MCDALEPSDSASNDDDSSQESETKGALLKQAEIYE